MSLKLKGFPLIAPSAEGGIRHISFFACCVLPPAPAAQDTREILTEQMGGQSEKAKKGKQPVDGFDQNVYDTGGTPEGLPPAAFTYRLNWGMIAMLFSKLTAKLKGEKLSRKQVLNGLRFFGLLNAGLFITALGIVLFKSPNQFAFGGTSGLSVILAALVPGWNVSAFMWIINLVLVGLGFCLLGWKSMGWTVYSSIALSFFTSLCEWIWPLAAPLTDDTFLEFCFAVLLPALGSGLVFNVGASTGGTDILAMILKKYTSLEIGKALMVSDLGIVAWGAFLFGPRTGMYCILGMVLKCTVVDSVIESLNLRKVCTIITQHTEEVERFIIEELHRSATEQPAFGAYTRREERAIVTVLTRAEATRLRLFLRKLDSGAFITVVNSSEIIGKGFRSI